MLPPISSLDNGIPLYNIDLSQVQTQQYTEMKPQKPQQTQVPLMLQNMSKGKPITFTDSEDLSILKAMRLYLGKTVSPKIPWSFWQLYRRFSGSKRSDSSLYHHWNGAMLKKYGNFIKLGKIDECIAWAESSIDLCQYKPESEEYNTNHQGRQLVHTRSQQVLPPPIPLGMQYSDKYQPPRQLVHFQSMPDADHYFGLNQHYN